MEWRRDEYFGLPSDTSVRGLTWVLEKRDTHVLEVSLKHAVWALFVISDLNPCGS